jgi:hypothetical protein
VLRAGARASQTDALRTVANPLPLSATAGAANRAVMERGSDTWRKLGQEILSLETNIDYIESMLLPDGEEQQGEEEEQQEQEQGSRGM